MTHSQAPLPIVVTYEGGLRFAAQVRSHRVVVDQPRGTGGDDSAPTPIEMLGVSLSTCVAYYVQRFCHARGIAYEGMRVETEQVSAGASPARIGKFAVRVILPVELPAHQAEMLGRAARSCPAHNTLTHGAEVDVQIGSEILASV
ncbi:MAG: OsmC family protein [bacterium]